jgi:hypothetical protein
MTKSKNATASESLIKDSHWTEGDISFRKGNRNILLIAPKELPFFKAGKELKERVDL